MKDLTVLLTSAGSPAFLGAVRGLRMNGERNIKIIGTGLDFDEVGSRWVDAYHVVPRGDDPGYVDAIKNIIDLEDVDVVLPLSTPENLRLAENRDEIKIPVLVSEHPNINNVTDKYILYRTLQANNFPSIPCRIVFKRSQLEEAAQEMGYFKGKTLCVKPTSGEGSRGFRILSQDVTTEDLTSQFFNQKSVLWNNIDSLKLTLSKRSWPSGLILMEYIEGPEYSVDLLLKDNKFVTGCVRRRDKVVNGISNIGTIVNRPDVLKLAAKIAEQFDLNYNIGVQIIEDKQGKLYPMEINPRLQGTTTLCLAAGLNLYYLGLKLALGEDIDVTHLDEVGEGTTMYRHLDEVYDRPVFMHHKYNLLVDFDGVIVEYDGKWKGEEHYGKLIGKEALQELSKEYNIIIYTARKKLENIKTFLANNGVPFNQVMHKPAAMAYIGKWNYNFKGKQVELTGNMPKSEKELNLKQKYKGTLPELSDGELGYIGGLIDGEGCFNCGKNGKGRHYMRLMIANQHIGVLKRIKNKLGGSIYTKKSIENRFPVSYWSKSGISLKPLLETLLEKNLIKMKAIQAELAITFFNLQRFNGREKSDFQNMQQTHIVNMIKEFNQRGQTHTPPILVDDRAVAFTDWKTAQEKIKSLRRNHDEFFNKYN